MTLRIWLFGFDLSCQLLQYVSPFTIGCFFHWISMIDCTFLRLHLFFRILLTMKTFEYFIEPKLKCDWFNCCLVGKLPNKQEHMKILDFDILYLNIFYCRTLFLFQNLIISAHLNSFPNTPSNHPNLNLSNFEKPMPFVHHLQFYNSKIGTFEQTLELFFCIKFWE